MLPNFLVIGAQKAATTTLHQVLGGHPDVFLATPKETNFLIDQGNWSRGVRWYESLFERGAGVSCVGEVSPGYTMHPHFRHAPERAHALVPDARIIYVIRHPVERMVSAWAHASAAGLEHLELEDALLGRARYMCVSCYGMQLSRWAQVFPANQLLVVRSEDLGRDIGGTLDLILEHLGLETGWRPAIAMPRYNRTNEKRLARPTIRRIAGLARAFGLDDAARRLSRARTSRVLNQPLGPAELNLSDELREALEELFRADFAQLRALVGPDLDLWGLA